MPRATTRRSHIDREAVRRAVAAAERATSAEIVVSIAPFFLGSVGGAAERAFDSLGVARTRRRNGVLVFVVPSRHQVVVLPDAEAAARVAPAVYERAATVIATACGRGEGTRGIVEAVELLASVLTAVFPFTGARENELPDLIA
ncbi:MAG: hypothetical protein SFX73_24740 [Kofleriaceae bacterium]|nr:hypothetical protein [Kofleriaceae bacterium]